MSAAPLARAWKIAGAVLLILIGVWAGARVHSHRTPRAVRVAVGEASPPKGDAATDMPDFTSAPAAKIPERLPEFSMSDRGGKTTSIATWAGKSLILNFWATWCAPCRREIPLLKSLSTDWTGRGMQVIGVAVDRRDKVASYADELKIPYPLLIGEQDALDVAAQFGMDSAVFPFTVFTDRRGEVITLYVGELHKAQADLILTVVQEVNENRLDLQLARSRIASGLRELPHSPG